MAIFDPSLQRLCVRIVYDGAGSTGKTTNLKSICSLFAAQRATESEQLVSPGEVDGRTLYFDWVQIMAGMVCGFPLMCQVISVPGQTVLTPRRRHLLTTADVIVLVCDSSAQGIERAAQGLHLIDEVGGNAQLVLQANKQDQVSAVPGLELVKRLNREGTPVVEAIATDGIGVIDTFVTAVRQVSRSIQDKSEKDGGFNIPVGRAPRASDLLARLDSLSIDPEWAAEMFLEEAQAAFLIAGDLNPSAEATSLLRGAPPMLPQSNVETGFVWPAHSGRMVLSSLMEETVDRVVPLDAKGQAICVAGQSVLRTSRDLRFADREEARAALVRAARERTQVDPENQLETVLVVQPARDDGWWLWTITPSTHSSYVTS